MDKNRPSSSKHGSSTHHQHHHQSKNAGDHNQKRRNYKLLVDPYIIKGTSKVYRFDGCIPNDPSYSPVKVRDPRFPLDTTTKKILEPHELPVPCFKVDKNYVGVPFPSEIIICNLNDNTNRKFLEGMVMKFGQVRELVIFYHPTTNKHLGLARVVFKDPRAARTCINRLHNTSVMGNIVKVFSDPGGEKCLRQFNEKTKKGENGIEKEAVQEENYEGIVKKVKPQKKEDNTCALTNYISKKPVDSETVCNEKVEKLNHKDNSRVRTSEFVSQNSVSSSDLGYRSQTLSKTQSFGHVNTPEKSYVNNIEDFSNPNLPSDSFQFNHYPRISDLQYLHSFALFYTPPLYPHGSTLQQSPPNVSQPSIQQFSLQHSLQPPLHSSLTSWGYWVEDPQYSHPPTLSPISDAQQHNHQHCDDSEPIPQTITTLPPADATPTGTPTSTGQPLVFSTDQNHKNQERHHSSSPEELQNTIDLDTRIKMMREKKFSGSLHGPLLRILSSDSDIDLDSDSKSTPSQNTQNKLDDRMSLASLSQSDNKVIIDEFLPHITSHQHQPPTPLPSPVQHPPHLIHPPTLLHHPLPQSQTSPFHNQVLPHQQLPPIYHTDVQSLPFPFPFHPNIPPPSYPKLPLPDQLFPPLPPYP